MLVLDQRYNILNPQERKAACMGLFVMKFRKGDGELIRVYTGIVYSLESPSRIS